MVSLENSLLVISIFSHSFINLYQYEKVSIIRVCICCLGDNVGFSSTPIANDCYDQFAWILFNFFMNYGFGNTSVELLAGLLSFCLGKFEGDCILSWWLLEALKAQYLPDWLAEIGVFRKTSEQQGDILTAIIISREFPLLEVFLLADPSQKILETKVHHYKAQPLSFQQQICPLGNYSFFLLVRFKVLYTTLSLRIM